MLKKKIEIDYLEKKTEFNGHRFKPLATMGVTCPLCDESFMGKRAQKSLVMHMSQWHTESYSCDYCRFTTEYTEGDSEARADASAKMDWHVATFHSCKYCPFVPPKRKEKRCNPLNASLKDHYAKTHPPCTNCGKPLKTSEDHKTSKQCVHIQRMEKYKAFQAAWDAVLDFSKKRIPFHVDVRATWQKGLCLLCEKEIQYMTDDADAYYIDHLRKCKGCEVDIRRPAAVGVADSHGWTWYCFNCVTSDKNHKSFSTSKGLASHLETVHGIHRIHSARYVEEETRVRCKLEQRASQ